VPAASFEALAPQYLVVQKRAADGERTIAELRKKLSGYENSLPTQKGQVKVLTEDLVSTKFLAGLMDATGPGVLVTLNDSKKRFPDAPLAVQMTEIVHDTDILQVVNELRAAGAEAVSVNDQRLVATSPIRCAGPTIYVNGTPQTPPYLVRAIGDPTVLETALKLPQGIYDTLHNLDSGMIKIQKQSKQIIPAYNGPTTPRYSHPVTQTGADGAGTGANTHTVAQAPVVATGAKD